MAFILPIVYCEVYVKEDVDIIAKRKVCFLRMEKTTILITGCPKSEKRKRLRLLRKVGWSLGMLEPHTKAHERQ